MYTGPTALISLLVFLPVFAAAVALVHSSMASTFVQIHGLERMELSRIAARAAALEVERNATLRDRLLTGAAGQGDMGRLASVAGEAAARAMGMGVTPTISIKVAVFNETLVKEASGFDIDLNPLYTYSLVQKQVQHWSVETVTIERGGVTYYVLVQAGY